jgi:hypothetical protein
MLINFNMNYALKDNTAFAKALLPMHVSTLDKALVARLSVVGV